MKHGAVVCNSFMLEWLCAIFTHERFVCSSLSVSAYNLRVHRVTAGENRSLTESQNDNVSEAGGATKSFSGYPQTRFTFSTGTLLRVTLCSAVWHQRAAAPARRRAGLQGGHLMVHNKGTRSGDVADRFSCNAFIRHSPRTVGIRESTTKSILSRYVTRNGFDRPVFL